MDISLTSFGQTDVGLKRQKNEDNFLIDEGLGLFIVADGMGGHKGGDLASELAVEALKVTVETGLTKNRNKFSPRDALLNGYTMASKNIFDRSHIENPELLGMGTTLVSALFFNNRLFFGNVGDSRAYLIRDGKLWQLTEDHSLVNEHIRAGLIRDADVDQFQAKNVITRSVGFERDVACDILEKPVSPGDRYMMCSDGLCGLVSAEEISSICQTSDIEKAVADLIDEAKRKGGDDNITVLM